MKKLLCGMLSLAMLLALFASCAQAPAAEAPASSVEASSAASSEAPADEKVVLKLGNWPEDTQTTEIELFKGYTAKFQETHPNVEVVPAYYFYALDTIVPLCESGQCPTIFQPWYTETDKMVNNGFVADMTDYLNERGWLEAMNPTIKEVVTRNGRTYGMPRDGYALGLMLNLELYEEAGLMKDGLPQYPKTWDELAKTAQTIKQKTGQGGFCLLANDNAGGWHFNNIAWGFGADLMLVGADGKETANVNTPEAIAAMEYVKSLKWTYDCLTADPLSENWGTAHASLGTGAAAMEIAANDAVSQPTQVNGLPVDKLALVPMPSGPKGVNMLSGGTPYMFAANSTPAQLNAALDFIQVMGRSPEVTDDIKAGMDANNQNLVDLGVPVIPNFPIWINPDRIKLNDDSVAKYSNVDMRLFNDYFEATKKPGMIRLEYPDAQLLYGELTKVLQAVVTDKNADVAALMATANSNTQILLDGGTLPQ